MAGVLQEAGDADSRVPDTKCKFITSPFLTLPYLLDCLICTRNAMPIVLLLKLMEHSPGAGGGGGGGVFFWGGGGGGGGGGGIFWVSADWWEWVGVSEI